MSLCEHTGQWLAESGWDEAHRKSIAEMLQHLESCPQCAARARDYDLIRSTLQAGMEDAPRDGWEAMEKRLEARVMRRPGRRFPWMALAASVLIAAMGYGVGGLVATWPDNKKLADIQPGPNSTAAPEKTAALSPAEMAQQAKAFDEISGVFDHRATWLLVGDRTSDMGVSEQKPVQEHGVLLMLRLTMLESGKVISNADLAILPGQTARLTVPGSSGTNLVYRISTSEGEPTRLAISTQLTTPGGTEALAALATTLNVEPGQKLSAGKMVTNSGAYELELAFGRADLNEGR